MMYLATNFSSISAYNNINLCVIPLNRPGSKTTIAKETTPDS